MELWPQEECEHLDLCKGQGRRGVIPGRFAEKTQKRPAGPALESLVAKAEKLTDVLQNEPSAEMKGNPPCGAGHGRRGRGRRARGGPRRPVGSGSAGQSGPPPAKGVAC